jgi:RIO kinase 1
MPSHSLVFDTEDLEETSIRNMPRAKKNISGKRKSDMAKKRAHKQAMAKVAALADGMEQVDFTYQASRHERVWILDSLGKFYDEKWLDDVLRLVKGGKEANVYQCLAHSSVTGLENDYIAAKVYRPRMFRNLRNDAMYREGRDNLDADGCVIIDDRMLRAIGKGTGFGKQLSHSSWIEHEVKSMETLYEAGADVPQVFASGHNAILMSYIGDADIAAPTLNSVSLDRDEARPLFQRVLHNVEIMLANHRVHGDLSAYNILYWQGKITLIDFPQVIDPDVNRSAFRIFERDLVRVCEYFAHQGVRSNPRRLAADLWTAYGHRLAAEVHPADLDEENEADRAYWKKVTQH